MPMEEDPQLQFSSSGQICPGTICHVLTTFHWVKTYHLWNINNQTDGPICVRFKYQTKNQIQSMEQTKPKSSGLNQLPPTYDLQLILANIFEI